MSSFAVRPAKWTLDVADRIVKADVRINNLEALRDDMAVIFVTGHFTRLETLLIPYALSKRAGKEVWARVGPEVFVGRIGSFLQASATIAAKDPDRDKVLVRSLLEGAHPWISFPEGAMVQDGNRADHRGACPVCNPDARGGYDTGAAALALRTEFYRRKIAFFSRNGRSAELREVLDRFSLTSCDPVLRKRAVLVPLNVTCSPMRARDNVLVRLGRGIAKDPGKRAVEEASIEGTVLAKGVDIHITLGAPIDVGKSLDVPEYLELVGRGMQDFDLHEQDPRSSFHEAARRLMRACMADARGLVTVNADHVLAALIRYCWWCAFPKRLLRHRAFLCAREIPKVHQGPLHQDFLTTLRDGLHDEPNPAWDDFLGLCEREGVLQNEGCAYRRNATVRHSRAGSRRRVQTATVIADEIEALPAVIKAIKRVTRTPGFLVLRRVRAALLEEDRRLFEKDYREFYEEGVTKGPEVGRPFLLKPFRVKAGVVLVHGYMAAPLEVRAMAEYLCAKGYAVYGVRMKGHGTSPADLAGTTWEDWYASINRGYAIIRTMTERVILGGFSMGAGLALLAAGRKAGSVRAVFAINAPLHLRSTAARLAPSMVRVTSLLKRFHWGRDEWEYVENEPENRHINYTRNPVRGVAELGEAMNVMAATLGDITAPALVIQGSRDPVVHPDSGPAIFDKIGTPRKELVVLERENHGIINGRGAMDVFDRVTAFLCRADRVAYAGPSNQRSNT